MHLRLEEPDQTELNMTPMIDIVFQLIIFFLLSLKFKTIDERIESMLPKNMGTDIRPSPAPVEDKITLRVFRRNVERSEHAYTFVKLDGALQFRLPMGWQGRAGESPARVREYDATLAAITTALRERVAIYGGPASGVKGEIVAPPPQGGSVPHGDVVALLDSFLAVGMTDVRFEGAAAPR
ncbi:MAG: biopolymer transporter ExbD [Planctomycetota bacterium]|nr:biopolymer transporter ExbD [Planctomycetota bacterium]